MDMTPVDMTPMDMTPVDRTGPYVRSARVYDAVNEAEGKDYAREADAILELIRDRAPGATSLLDVACGTGRHLEHFARHLRCEGVDRDAGMLELAKKRCPEVPFTRADMTDFDLGRRFDAVVCLFSTVGHLLTTERLGAAVQAMARHLSADGVLIVEPWFQPAQWMDGYLSLVSVDLPDLKVARLSISGRRGNIAELDFHYLVGAHADVDAFVEHYELALFTWEEYRAAFERAGLVPEVDEHGLTGRGLVVGVARAGPPPRG
ncbi:MAG TPA: class I SAM-dependent methyltransferase [Acidimicrobiales bacterium]|nr:class I SAM-dependent methyltransferase [Acidimicrobiales bacterium]